MQSLILPQFQPTQSELETTGNAMAALPSQKSKSNNKTEVKTNSKANDQVLFYVYRA